MFNLGFWEVMVLALVALVIVGPEKLPQLAKNVAAFLNDLKRTTNTLTQELRSTPQEEEKFYLPEDEEDMPVCEIEADSEVDLSADMDSSETKSEPEA